MDFKDVLKKLKLGDINLVKIEVDNSKNFQVKDSNFVIDAQAGDRLNYTLPNTVEYNDVKNKSEEIYKSGTAGFVRKDIVLPEVGMVSSRVKHKEVFRFYKGTIKPEHYHALISVYTIIEFEDRGDSKTSNDLFKKMVKKFGEDARHIYNFARSGLIEGRFWYDLGMINYQGASKERVYQMFSSQFASYINFYPYATWVSPYMSFKDVVQEIRIRINRKEVNRLDVYIRGQDKIDLLWEDLIDLIDQKDGIEIEAIPKYTICNSPCRKVTIIKKPDFLNF